MARPLTPSRQARLAAGYSAQQVATRLHRSVRYLLERERENDFPLIFAERLARFYGASISDFLPTPATGGAARRVGRRHTARPRRKSSGMAG